MRSLMPGRRRGGTFAVWKGRAISQARYLTQVRQLAASLPDTPYLINLCEDRFLFSLSLCAALARDIRTLLPPNRLAATVREIAERYPGSLVITDTPNEDLGLTQWRIDPADFERLEEIPDDVPPVPLSDRADAIIVFTSGSTGAPQPHPKRWTDQMLCSDRGASRFGIGPDTRILATVPPQHMYGLELSVLIPLATGATIHAGRPFYPEDIRAALAEIEAPRVLVTTPVHLAACAGSEIDWPEIDFVISATAPLDAELAALAERRLGTRVFEIFGCTEAGSIASRRTLDGPRWRWYDGVRARPAPDREGIGVTADFLPSAIPLNDVFELEDERHFRLVGRGSDLVNVAGKRASLADLNRRLNAIPGVREGVMLAPDPDSGGQERLAAVVVAPELDRTQILDRLREQMDPAFLPRPLVLVERLPRNEVGKTPRQWLLSLLRTERGRAE